jgi:protein-arginine kinase activator protein McsA
MNKCYDCGAERKLLHSLTVTRGGQAMSVALCAECAEREGREVVK